MLDNRVLPVVDDFGGKPALRSVAADMRTCGLPPGVLYASNVELYLYALHEPALSMRLAG